MAEIYMNVHWSSAYVVVRYRQLRLKLSSWKLSDFSIIWRAFAALIILLEPKGRGGKAAWVSFTVNTLSEKP